LGARTKEIVALGTVYRTPFASVMIPLILSK